jgi:hypothetical protein
MSDLRNILKEEYTKKERTITPDSLLAMIEEIVAFPLGKLQEESAPQPKVRTYHISEIPLIPISELGWANADEEASMDDPNVPPSQRQGLEQYLAKIPGTGFKDKLNAVSRIMKEGINSIPKDNPKEFIQRAMAYLVFYKTLTMAITNFNASAAGFNFEAFLAALMEGKQIPAKGADTIADITANVDGERIPISLKLYSDKGLEVGGSFVDLSNDMIEPNPEWAAWVSANPEFDGGAMRYIACTKTLDGEGVEQEGRIDFYQFDITRKNLFQILSVTSKGKSCIQSNRQFMDAVTHYMKTGEEPEVLQWAANIPARSDTSDSAEISSLWSTWLDKTDLTGLRDSDLDDSQIEAIKDAVLRLYIDSIENTQSAITLGTDSQLKGAILSVINPEVSPRARHPDAQRAKQVAILFLNLFKQFKKEVIRTRDARGNFLNTVEEWVTGPEVAQWYSTLTPELKTLAIKNCRGYLGHYHWVLPRGETIKLGGGTPFAKLEIGAAAVIRVLESARGELMDEVFGIFDQVSAMSDSLNAFFANGLQEPQQASQAAQSADAVGTDTRKIAGINK